MSCTCINLSANTKLRLTGSDRVRYLNGQVSNNVTKATAHSAIAACVTTAKGKLNAFAFITLSDDGESFLIDSDPELRESLAMRLERYIISDDCELSDVTDEFEFVHCLGETPPSGYSARRNDQRFGQPGHDLWLAPGTFETQHWKILNSAEAEHLRIENGIPKWGAELTENTLPAEARLDATAVDFHKGCYIGQEVISRIKSVGRVNRLLVKLQGKGLATGMSLHNDNQDEIGIITSASGDIALGYVKRDFTTPGTALSSQNLEKELSTICEISKS
jgi:folate-binding protein YgfZ